MENKNIPIAALDVFLSTDFMNSSRISGRVHSVFEHSLNAVLGKNMLTIHGDIFAGIPDGIVLKHGDFFKLRGIEANVPIFLNGQFLSLGDNKISLNSARMRENFFPKNCSPRRKSDVKQILNEINFTHKLGDKTEFLLADLFNALDGENIAERNSILEKLIGLGNGLTPSADDALVGVAAVLCFSSDGNGGKFADFADVLYRLSDNRTSDISVKYFRHAAQERFSLPILAVVSSLLDSSKSFDYHAFEKLLSMGHSSGKDTFRGILLAAKHFV